MKVKDYVCCAPFVRSPYNYDRDAASRESALVCLDGSLTVQAAKEDCDINTIVRRFGLTGKLPEEVRAPQYGDFTGVGDYQEALNAVKAAEASFMAMPAAVRGRFENDPGLFVDFCSNPENRDEMRKLGLLVPEKGVTPPVDVRVLVDDRKPVEEVVPK